MPLGRTTEGRRAVSLEDGATPGGARCPACDYPLFVWVESEAIFRGIQKYFVWDAAVGVVERGEWSVARCVEEQPWLPNGPVPHTVSWRKEGYERVRWNADVMNGVARFPAGGRTAPAVA